MIFNSSNVLVQKISEAQLRTYYIGFDLGICQINSFSEILMDAIVDFAFGYHTGILKQYDRRKLKEAAKAIYNIKEYSDVKWTYIDDDSLLVDDEIKAQKKYLKRGEFGELILHLILRDYFKTIPLLSKIFFKDTDGLTVHGFDSVHIGPDLTECGKSSIYLGESKVYYRKDGKAGENGIDDLIDDIKTHFKQEFIKRECSLIAKKKHSFPNIEEYCDKNTKEEYIKFTSEKKHWFDIFEKIGMEEYKLQDFLNSVTIPLICTYESQIFTKCKDDSHPDFLEEYESEMRALQIKFNKSLHSIEAELGKPITSNLNVILILFPIPSKKKLIKTLHSKLFNQQNA